MHPYRVASFLTSCKPLWRYCVFYLSVLSLLYTGLCSGSDGVMLHERRNVR